MSDGATWQLRVLGDLELVDAVSGATLPIGRAQTRLLLCALAASPGHRLDRHQLEEVLWPGSVGATAESAVRVAVNRARTVFGAGGAEAIVFRSGGYELSSSVVVDADQWLTHVRDAERHRGDDRDRALESWAAARALWRETPFRGTESPVIDEVRRSLEQTHCGTGVREVLLLAETDPVEAAYRAERLASAFPGREDIAALAVRHLARSGRVHDALTLASATRTQLREWGLTPGADLTDAESEALTVRSQPASILNSERRTSPVHIALEPTTTVSANREALDGFSPLEELQRGNEAESRGDLGQASKHWWSAVVSADPIFDGSTLALAALAGSGHNSTIGGDFERRRRLRLAAERLDDHPLRDDVIADLALESFNCRLPLDESLLAEVRGVAKRHESPAYVLALRWQISVDHIAGLASLEDAKRLASACLDIKELATHHRSAGLAVAVGTGAAFGALELADTWASELEYVGTRTGEARARWQSLAFRTTIAEMTGRSDLADSHATAALQLGRELAMPDAEATFGLHLMGRTYRSGSMAPFAPTLAAAEDRYKFPIWAMLRARAELDAGNERLASQLLERNVGDAVGVPDHFTVAAVAVAADVAARLGHREAIATVDPVLRNRREAFVLIGYGGPCIGPIDLFSAKTAEVSGDIETAVSLRHSAAAACRTAGANAWLHHVLEQPQLSA
jgi:DNA-binding SARP family transcriptional activator